MKKVRVAAFVVVGMLTFTACGGTETSSSLNSEDTSVSEDIASEANEDSTADSTEVEVKEEDFEYVVLEDGTIGITGYKGSASVLGIPDAIEGHTVTSVAGLSNNETITKVIIPDSVTIIEENAFYSDDNLEEVVIGKGVKTISEDAFDQATKLSKINIPDTVTEIGENAFCMTAIKEISIPSSVSVLNPYMFSLTPIEKITIPGTVKTIEQGVFEGCTELKEVVIEDGVETIGEGVFDDCEKLQTLEIPASVTTIESYYLYDCTIIAPAGSYAETFANENGYNFKVK